MNSELPKFTLSPTDAAFLATPPFSVNDHGFVVDAKGDRVIVCDNDPSDRVCDLLYSERAVDADPHFICPKCGRLGQRMEEVSPKNAGLSE